MSDVPAPTDSPLLSSQEACPYARCSFDGLTEQTVIESEDWEPSA